MNIDMLKFAAFVSMLTKHTGCQFDGYDVGQFKTAVEGVFSTEQDQPLSNADEIENLLKSMVTGRKIDAIRSHRVLTRMGLKESKDLIEKYYTSQPVQDTRVSKMINKIRNQQTDRGNGVVGGYVLDEFNDNQLNTIVDFIESFHQ